MPAKTSSALSSRTPFFSLLGILNSPPNLSKLRGSLHLELLERFERSLFNESLQKPPAPYAVIIDPGDGATAGFGEVVIALDLSVPPAAGKDVGAGKLVDAAVLVSQHEPTIFVSAARCGRQKRRLSQDSAHENFSAFLLWFRKLDAAERFPSKACFGKVSVG